MWAIAKSTFQEVNRKRIVHVVAILTLLYWGILGFIFYSQPRSFGGGGSLINDLVNISALTSILGFYLSSMLMAFLTVMLSVGVISSEVEDGTVLTLLTKPIHRFEYVLGKYLGIAIMIIIYATTLFIAIVLFAFLGKQNFFQTFGVMAMFKGYVFFLLQPLAILAVAVLGSTIFKTVNNGIFVIALYLLGIIGGLMEQIGGFMKAPDLTTFGIVASLFAPFEAIYRKLVSSIFAEVGGFTSLMGGAMSGPGTEPSVWMMVYVLVYMGCAIGFGIRRMNRRDIG